MPVNKSDRTRFTEMRARALTEVLLTGRSDLTTQEVSGFDYGIDFLVTVRSPKQGLRQFGVEIRATHSPVTAKTANSLLKPTMQGIARYAPFAFPVVLFYYTMMEPQSWFTWVMEPIDLKDGGMTLLLRVDADCRVLDSKAVDDIVNCVDRYFDHEFGNQKRPTQTKQTDTDANKQQATTVLSDVVISDVDSMTFDYSDTLLTAHAELSAARECSNYIVKTYPTPLRTLTGWWNLEVDRKGRKLVTLLVKDQLSKKTKTIKFTPNELKAPSTVYQRFYESLGDVL